MLIIIQKIHTTCTTPSSSPQHPTHPMGNRPDTGHPGLRPAAYIKPQRGYLNVLKNNPHPPEASSHRNSSLLEMVNIQGK